MFDVIIALESCMICEVLSSGCVRSARGIVALLITPHGDNWFILHLPEYLSNATFAATVFEKGKRFVHHVVMRHGNATSVRDVLLVRLILTQCSSKFLWFTEDVLMNLLST